MNSLFDDIRKSLKDDNFYAALFMILTIPDICIAIQNGKSSGGQYVNWFENNLPQYKGFMSGKDCYAFRCAILHEGTGAIGSHHYIKDSIEKFIILSPEKASHLIYLGGNTYNGVLQPTKLALNLHNFCNDIIAAATGFLSTNGLTPLDLINIETSYNDGMIIIQ